MYFISQAMTSVPGEEDDEDHEHLEPEPEEDIQSFSAAERRSKSKRKNADVRYISLKPFFKKDRKRPRGHNDTLEAELESNNGAAQDDFDNQDEHEDQEFIKASPVPLPDVSTCKSILHRFGYNNKTATPHKKKFEIC